MPSTAIPTIAEHVHAAGGTDEDKVVVVVDQAHQKQSWLGIFWDTADLSREERRLLFKVDASLLIFASLGYFIKNLDQSNVNNAFLSGMKDDLNMQANQLVTSTSIWTVGYVIGQIPSNLLLTRAPAHLVIPLIELGWGVCTLGTYAVKDYRALYALRFLVGLFESAFYPGMHYLLGSWYTSRELTKRSTIFWTAGSLGTMFSGFLQSAAYTNLNGVNGLAGWRWLFIVDAIITIPIAIIGFVFLPDTPWSAKPSFLLSAADIELARGRMEAVGRAAPEPWSKAKFKRIFTSWHPWCLPLLYVIWNNSSIQQPMGYWLKSFNAKPPPVPGTSWTVSQINILPLPATAIFVVAALIFAWICDGPLRGRRWPLIPVGALITLVIGVALLETPVYGHNKAHFALYYLLQVGGGCGPMILNWISEITGADNEKRALCVALGNDLAYVVQAVAPNFIWKVPGTI